MFAAALSLSGCGGEKSGDVAHGRELYQIGYLAILVTSERL